MSVRRRGGRQFGRLCVPLGSWRLRPEITKKIQKILIKGNARQLIQTKRKNSINDGWIVAPSVEHN